MDVFRRVCNEKTSFRYISFVLLSLCILDVTFAGLKKTSIDGDASIKVNNNVGKTRQEIFFAQSNRVGKEIEVNSVNFIKLEKKANEIFIPDPNIIDVQMLSDNSLYLIGLAPGTTYLVINDKDGNVLVDCRVKVTYPLKSIQEAILELHPDSCVEIVSVDDSVVLKGKVPSPEAASDIQDIVSRFVGSEKILNRLSIETSTQVMLKVKIAEVSRSVTKSIGIDWRAVSTGDSLASTNFGFLRGSTKFPGALDLAGGGGAAGDAAADAAAGAAQEGATSVSEAIKKVLMESGDEGVLSGSVEGGKWLIHSFGKHALSGLLEALASESFASILAEPTIIALSGKKAIFKSGGEKGYLVTQENSNNKTTEFKEWGTSIEFTPVVLSEDRINITVCPKVSSLDTSASDSKDAPPALSTKEASTTVELGSGESMAIAGLLQKEKSTSSSETPFLAEIPIVGSLFRSSKVKNEDKEIVIIVTPYIVKPSSKQLKTPVDMVPKMYSPLESIISRKFHMSARSRKNGKLAAGFSVK